MKGKLYLNSELIEADINIPLAFISNQLNDLNDKRTGMSGTIILEKNEKFHEDSEIWDSEIDCDYIMNGIKLVSNGKARLLKFTDKEVHIKIYFGALLLSEVLKEIKINELVDETLNIDWDFTHIAKSCEDEDVFFIFANTDVFGESNFITSNKVNARRLIPAIKVRKLIELIETETDIEFTGDFATDTLIDNMCMPINVNKPESESFTASKDMPLSSDFYDTLEQQGGGSMYFQTQTDEVLTESTGNTELVSGKIKITKAGIYDVDINAQIRFLVNHLHRNDYEDVDYTITIQTLLYKNGSHVASNYSTQDLNTRDFWQNVEVNFNEKNIITNLNDVFHVTYAYIIEADVTGAGSHVLTLSTATSCEIGGKNAPIQYGSQDINILALLPEMTALEFIKSLIQKKGFVIDFDFVNEKFILNYFDTLYKNLLIADDWSDVFKDYEITDIYGVFGRNNLFRYSNDKDIDENYGGYSILVDKETLPPETIILQDKTAGTTQEEFTEFSNNFEICRIPCKSTYKLEWEKLNPRFLLFERKDVTQITITDGVDDIGVTAINYVWFKNNQNFNLDYEFLVKRYYSNYISMFDRYRKYTITAQLHSSDCIRNQLKPVYIKQLNAYFFVEKINYVSDTQLSTIELIRL